jgi:predicted MFS family arabinose efflux permease
MGVNREPWITVVVALAALLLTLMVLMFVERNPWMLIGVAAILWAIAAIVRAVRGAPAPDHTKPAMPSNQRSDANQCSPDSDWEE